MKIVVDISDCRISRSAQDSLTTYSLGSCIGVVLYDAFNRLGGMLHYQLPTSTMDAEKARQKPLMFADSGMEYMLKEMLRLGANPKKLTVKLAGGAQVMDDAQIFNIGKRNYAAIRQWLWNKGMFIDGEDVGGKSPRNMTLDLDTGKVTVKSRGVIKEI